MRLLNKYSIQKSNKHWQRRLRLVQLTLVLLSVSGMVGARFLVDQALTFQASNESPNVVQVANPSQRTTIDSPTFAVAELIELNTGEEIQAVIDQFASQHPGASFGISVKSLDGSFSAGLNSSEQFDAASLYKTLASYKVLQMVDSGQLNLNQKTNAGPSLEECIELAITVSDNPCGIALQSLADPSSTDQAVLDWGYSQSSLSGYYPQTSALDQHQLFNDIFNGNRLSQTSRTLLLGHLANQQVLNRTPSYENAEIYLKTGDLGNAVHSAAVVESSVGSYTIAILSDDWDMHYLSKYSAISDIHKQIHEVISNQ